MRKLLPGLLFCFLSATQPINSQAPAASPHPPAFEIHDPGVGSVAITGPWQFHLGDDMTWAEPDLDDATGHNGWGQAALGQATDSPQTYSVAKFLLGPFIPGVAQVNGYTGYLWYRRRIRLSSSSRPPGNLAFMVGQVDGAYQVYWNGALVGQRGVLPPRPTGYASPLPSTFGLGEMRDGVLALRVWRPAWFLFSSSPPRPSLGGGASIAAERAAVNYEWLLSRQYDFSLELIYGLFGAISLLAWWWNRRQPVLLWTSVLCFGFLLYHSSHDLWLPWRTQTVWLQSGSTVYSIALWYLLLYLLDLRNSRALRRVTLGLTILTLVTVLANDAFLAAARLTEPNFAFWSALNLRRVLLVTDINAIYPCILLLFGFARRRHPARLVFASTATLSKVVNLPVIYLRPLFGTRNALQHQWQSILRVHHSRFADSGFRCGRCLWLSARSGQTPNQISVDQELKAARSVQQVIVPGEIP